MAKLSLAVLLGTLLSLACADREDEVARTPTAEPEAVPDTSIPTPTRRALWVLAEGRERVLEDPARVERLIEKASLIGVTDLFVQVYRRGRSWFPSAHADDAPARRLPSSRIGAEAGTLNELLESAHARGIRVHAWFNVLSLARNAQAPLLTALGRDAVLVDREGRSLLDYPNQDVPPPDRIHTRLGTPGIYLDPAVPSVVEYLERTVDDLVLALPALDGLHLDYIRHPVALPIIPGSRFDLGLDFGYGEITRRRFEEWSGGPFHRGDAWDDFRRGQVGVLVQRLCARLPEPWECSAAVLPWAERAYLAAMQDWRRWLEEGALDFAVAMAYTRDDRLLRYLAHGLTGGVAGERVWLGLGAWLFTDRPERLQAQLDRALEVSPAGVALFSYDALIEQPGLLEGLRWTPK
ncbi:MAG: glycoside hydrolase family 10 protein [Myxococcota bacterium]